MEKVLDRQTIETTEKELHNAMINERYRKLLSAVEDQMATPMVEEAYATTYAPEVPVYDAPATEQAPTVTEYQPSAVAASVFTTEKFERLEREVSPVAPTQTKAVTKVQSGTLAQYSLTAFAKVAMAVFTLVVVAMLVLIGINSQTMRRQSVRIQNLEEKKQELVERNEEIQQRIQELQTDESILERAQQAGLID